MACWGFRVLTDQSKDQKGFYFPGPIFPFPDAEKKLDFSPSLVEIKRPIRKIVGTATNKRLAMKPKLVVSIT